MIQTVTKSVTMIGAHDKKVYATNMILHQL